MYTTDARWIAGPRVEIGTLPRWAKAIDIQGRQITVDHTHKGCTFARLHYEGGLIETCYAANAEVLPCQ